MSCPSEAAWAVYVDGELVGEDVKRVEAHLVACRDCRALVVGLRDEVALLRDTLEGRERESFAPAPAHREPETRGIALGLPIAVAAVTAVIAVAGYLIETRLPGGFDFLNPMRLKGAYEMAFDVVFILRDEVPGLLELVLSLAALVSASALASLALGALYRRIGGPIALSLALSLACVAGVALPASHARALDLRLDADLSVARGETIPETLVASGENLDVDGIVDGNFIAWGERVTIRGEVRGSVYAFTRELEITGKVTGSVHAISENLRVEGQVEGSLVSGIERAVIASGARVGGDLGVFGDGVVLEGDAARDFVFAGDWLEVRGSVGRDLDVLTADRVALYDSARVTGNVAARLQPDEQVEVAPGAVVGGELTTTHWDPRGHYLAHYMHPEFYLWFLVKLGSALCFGLLLYLVAPGFFDARLPTTRGFFRSLGLGFALLICTPIAIVLTALTLVGIPLAVLATFVYLTALYLAHILVGALVGRALLHRAEPGFPAFARSFLVGVGLISVAVALPFLGFAVGLVVILLGLGMLAQRGQRMWLARVG